MTSIAFPSRFYAIVASFHANAHLRTLSTNSALSHRNEEIKAYKECIIMVTIAFINMASTQTRHRA